MTDATRRLIQNLRPTLQGFNLEQLYQLALGLRHELATRGVDCTPEADALVAALLGHARTEHAAIFSADFPPRDDDERRPWSPPPAQPWRERAAAGKS